VFFSWESLECFKKKAALSGNRVGEWLTYADTPVRVLGSSLTEVNLGLLCAFRRSLKESVGSNVPASGFGESILEPVEDSMRH